jgi:hypothetical protein
MSHQLRKWRECEILRLLVINFMWKRFVLKVLPSLNRIWYGWNVIIIIIISIIICNIYKCRQLKCDLARIRYYDSLLTSPKQYIEHEQNVRKNFFLIGIVEGGIQLGPLGSAATNRPIVPASGDYDGEIGGMIGRGNRTTRRKPVPVPLCPPQTPHAARTRTQGHRGGKLTNNIYIRYTQVSCQYRLVQQVMP